MGRGKIEERGVRLKSGLREEKRGKGVRRYGEKGWREETETRDGDVFISKMCFPISSTPPYPQLYSRTNIS